MMSTEVAVGILTAGSGILGAFVGALVPSLQTWWFAREDRKRQARYLAIRVVCVLDKFAENCADVAYDDGTCQGNPAGSDGCYEAQASLPDVISFAEDVNWNSIDPNLMYRIISLPSHAEATKRAISSASNDYFPPYDDYFEARQFEYTCLTLTTLALARELRAKYSIPSHDHLRPDLVESLMEHKTEFERGKKFAEAQTSDLCDLDLAEIPLPPAEGRLPVGAPAAVASF